MAIEKTIVIKTDTQSATKDIKNLEKAVEGVNKEVQETTESSSELTGQLDNLTGGAISKFKAFKTSLKLRSNISLAFLVIRFFKLLVGVCEQILPPLKSHVPMCDTIKHPPDFVALWERDFVRKLSYTVDRNGATESGDVRSYRTI